MRYLLSHNALFDIDLKSIALQSYPVYPGLWDPEFPAIVYQYSLVRFMYNPDLRPDGPFPRTYKAAKAEKAAHRVPPFGGFSLQALLAVFLCIFRTFAIWT